MVMSHSNKVAKEGSIDSSSSVVMVAVQKHV